MSIEKIRELAADHNCTVRVATNSELMFDLDTKEACESFEWFFACKIEAAYPQARREMWRNKSGNHHIVVDLGETLPVVDRIAMQAMGGSDAGREFAALRCHNAGSPHPVLLFVPRGAA